MPSAGRRGASARLERGWRAARVRDARRSRRPPVDLQLRTLPPSRSLAGRARRAGGSRPSAEDAVDGEGEPLAVLDPDDGVAAGDCRDVDVVLAVRAAAVAGSGVVVRDALAAEVVVLGLDRAGERDVPIGRRRRRGRR